MKRKLFFWLEKLKITRAERHAVSSLTVVLALLLGLNMLLSPSSPFDENDYRELEKQFMRRTALLEQKEQQVWARYYPGGQTVSAVGDTIPAEQSASSTEAMAPAGGLININTADAKTLQKLSGIGAAYAERIIAYRRENGSFQSKEDLLSIKGIGPARLAKISPFISIGESRPNRELISKATVEKDEPRKVTESLAPKAVAVEFVINVNTADAKTLEKLSGIGPAYARRIIEYRQQNGPFATKDDLMKIKGIGKKRLAKIKPFIKLTEQQ